jgi:NAD(P)-dependent dehydrogenase (short-subunit alcohol dehydrogenase family)/catechol 2,3-dioxygenase-like lactoylglutathione lyase family enzyme
MTESTTQTALITGASRGLGLALARRLARDGWRLIVDARGAGALEAGRAELAGLTQITAIPGDVTDPAHRRILADAARDAGGLDALVNNASILGPSPQPELLDYPLDALEEVYRTNVVAPLALVQELREMLKPGARIVNVTSDAAVEPYEGWGGYGPSKAALEHLSAILAAENPSLRVYWADPGDMRTQMHQEAFPDEDISDRPLPEESVPGLIELLKGVHTSGRYKLRDLSGDGGPPAIQELRVALTVGDFDRSTRFYRNDFGLPVVDEWSSEEGRGLLLSAGKATLELVDAAQAEYIDQIEAGERVSGPVRLASNTPDVQASADALQETGADTKGDAILTPWGHLNRRLRDPNGLQLTLFQSVEDVSRTEVL